MWPSNCDRINVQPNDDQNCSPRRLRWISQIKKSTRTVRRSHEDLTSLVWKWNETISKSPTTSPPEVFRLLLLHRSHQRWWDSPLAAETGKSEARWQNSIWNVGDMDYCNFSENWKKDHEGLNKNLSNTWWPHLMTTKLQQLQVCITEARWEYASNCRYLASPRGPKVSTPLIHQFRYLFWSPCHIVIKDIDFDCLCCTYVLVCSLAFVLLCWFLGGVEGTNLSFQHFQSHGKHQERPPHGTKCTQWHSRSLKKNLDLVWT